MKIVSINLQKSRTIETSGLLGREAYKKMTVTLHAELEDKDNYEECYKGLEVKIEQAFNEETLRIEEQAKKLREKVKPRI